jgi:deoxyadenosine/deoxycytidine kinase
MSGVSKLNRGGQKTPRVVEIIGPAGAGKTTLGRMLNNYQDKICLSDFPNVRKIGDAPFFIRYGLGLVPTLHRIYQRSSRQLRRREFAWMSILMGWSSVLQKDAKHCSKVIILDQGPVYLMAEMREFGPEYLRDQKADKLWQSLYYRWANTLDVIVWLDASDANLLERIRTRDQEHVVKNELASTVFEFLARYRRTYKEIISMLEANTSGLRVLRFDTGRQQPKEIADHLLVEFGCSQQAG